MTLTKAKEPFEFHTRWHLSELTGVRAHSIVELLEKMKEVSGSCIYYHTHKFLQQHLALSPEPPNDFAYWIETVLGERMLAEKLSSIDIMQFSSIRALREKMISTLEGHLTENPYLKTKTARGEEGFHFIKAVSFVVSTGYTVNDLKEFCDVLAKVSVEAIYFHIFEARLRLEKKTNDFSCWIETSVGDKKLADKIAGIDPYTRTVEDLRKNIIDLITRRIS